MWRNNIYFRYILLTFKNGAFTRDLRAIFPVKPLGNFALTFNKMTVFLPVSSSGNNLGASISMSA